MRKKRKKMKMESESGRGSCLMKEGSRMGDYEDTK